MEGNGKEPYSIVYFEAEKMLLSRFLDWENCDIYLGKQIPRLGNCDMFIRKATSQIGEIANLMLLRRI